MAFDKFLIAPFNSGLQRDVKPWLIPDDAFDTLQNTYVFRGRVRKRFGSRFMGTGWSSAATEPLFSRLRINLGNTSGAGNMAVTVPGAIFKVGQSFSIGNEIFTVSAAGTPGVMLTTGASTVHTYNTNTGALVINGAAIATPAWFYPAEPVMGLTNYEFGPINNQPSYAFDTQFAYLFAGGFWQRSGTLLLHGNNIDFVWTANFRGAVPGNKPVMLATNYNVVNPNGISSANDDPIWETPDGTNWTALAGAGIPNANSFYFAPNGGAHATGPYVVTSRLIVGFADRLVLLSTIENDNAGGVGVSVNTEYKNRVRYSHNGSPFATNAWYEASQTDAAGAVWSGAGFLDATTEESIVSCEFIKNRLIVFFERSTWELAQTNNPVLPFVWRKLNTELGCEAQFSSVPFDKVILTMGTTGVHACNGSNVDSIDDKIPDQVFEIQNKDLGIQRVAGTRDYFTEMVYWTFPATTQNPSISVYPNQVLIYNYVNGSWSINTDCITCWGYFEQQISTTWSSTTLTWETIGQPWSSGSLDSNFRQVIAGNQQGYVFICDADNTRNARAMQITNMATSGTGTILTIIDHTLAATSISDPTTGDYIAVENIQGATLSTMVNGALTVVTNGIYAVQTVINANQVFIQAVLTGTYTGGGTASRVSNMNLVSKQWNPYVDKDINVYLGRIDFGVQTTQSGQVTVDYFPSSTELSMIDDGTASGAIMGTNILELFPYNPIYYPLEQVQTRLWHPIYFQSVGECIQINIYMNDAVDLAASQIRTPAIAYSDFEIDGMVLYTNPVGRLQ